MEKRERMAVIGIDLGTTNSLASVFRGGKVELIPNSFGEYLTPSVVSFGGDGEVFVGKIAKERLITHPERTFAEFKRDMGTNLTYLVGSREYWPEELSAFVLRRLKEDAENYLGEPVTEAVISVPAYFNDDKRCATKRAGRLAGLTVERLINEPSAVALKHHMDSDEPETMIVFDFGGGTLDVSLVEAFDNMVEIQAVAGDNYLGGKDFDKNIEEYFYKEQNIVKSLLSKEDQSIVRKEAEQLKRELSEKNTASRSFWIAGREYTMSLTNQQLIHISTELFGRMAKPIQKVLNDSEMELDEIDRIILVGGSSKMPVVAQYIRSLSDVPTLLEEQPDESIALGVGIAAAIKERKGAIKDMILADICPFSLGTAVYDGTFSPIIQRNESLPCRRSQYYTTIKNNQTKLTFPIYQGESLVAKENLLLGTLEIQDLPKLPKGEVVAEVTFIYDINGILDIQIVSGEQSFHQVILNKNMGLTESQIEKRIEELQRTTLHPLEQEETQLLVEKAERLFMESSPRNREYIAYLLRHFKEVALHERGRVVHEEVVRLSLCLEAMERDRFDFQNFDESFWKEGKEVDE